MRAVLVAILTLFILASSVAFAQTTAVPTLQSYTASGYTGEAVGLGRTGAGIWYVLFEDDASGLIRWEPLQGTFASLGIFATDVTARGPVAYVMETLGFGPFVVYTMNRFAVDGLPDPDEQEQVWGIPEWLRGDRQGNAGWRESGSFVTWPLGESFSSFSALYPGVDPYRAVMSEHQYYTAALEFYDSVAGQWVITSLVYDSATDTSDVNWRPPYVQQVAPELDLFPGYVNPDPEQGMPNVIHVGDLVTLKRRQLDYPWDTKGDWDLSALCNSVHAPQGGGYSSDIFGRLAVFHGQGCVDGPSVLYAISLVQGVVYFVDVVPSSPDFELYEDSLAYIDDTGDVHFIRLDMTAFPPDPDP